MPKGSRGFESPYLRLNASPMANAPMGPSFFTPTQEYWRDQTRQITRPTPGRRGIFQTANGAKPAMNMFRRTHAPNGDAEVSMLSPDETGWLDMGGPPITNPDPIYNP